jgi:beta-phosphoglucomutase family hydrolase
MTADSDGNDDGVVIAANEFDAVLFDMDGVVTDTTGLHRDAWKRLFDDYLARCSHIEKGSREFTDADYRARVDGRPREAGVAEFLRSRGIVLPAGSPDDAPGDATVWALANRKNELFRVLLAEHGPRVFTSAVALVRRVREEGLHAALVTASQNAKSVLSAAGVDALFDVCVDGTDLVRLSLPGKPDPAPFLEAARRLGVDPARAVVIEDALAGVRAGREGGFGLVIGVDHAGKPQGLRDQGAHAVVADLSVVTVEAPVASKSLRCSICERSSTAARAWIFDARDRPTAGEGTREALCTLGNGYLATRGCASEARADGRAYPGTYVAGVLNRLASNMDGRTREDEAIVNLPNWLPLSFRVDGGMWLAPETTHVLHDHWLLDLAVGMLERELHVRDQKGRRTRLRERRIVSMADPHLVAQQATVIADNWSGLLGVQLGIDAEVENTNVAEYAALASRHLQVIEVGHADSVSWICTQTTQSRVQVAQAVRIHVEGPANRSVEVVRAGDRVVLEFELPVVAGAGTVVEKVVGVATSRDYAISEATLAARERVTNAAAFEKLRSAHAVAWRQLWRQFHLTIKGSERAQQVLNLHLFHVLQTLSPHTADLDVGVPARGLHGEGYRGHYFWDELFVFGLLNTRFPQLTRELLLYRYRRLPKARELAREAGHAGAMFPWQSGSDGREETPRELFNLRSGRWMPDNSRRQYHVNLAVAYNVWQYWEVSGDLHFLVAYGAELLVEIARFWASLASHDSSQDRFALRGVMGPDEFHDGYPNRPGEGIDNNAYTNVMVAWLMGRVLELVDLIGPRDRTHLFERLAVKNDELERWEHMSRRLLVPHHDGIISQFSGYETLLELDWDAYRSRYVNIGRLDLILESEGDTPNRYKVSKQADVLMLFYLFSADELRELLGRLGYSLEPVVIPQTIDYYLRRTSHGSTLSRVVHSWVLARADRARSWTLFNEALEADIADTQGGTTREGIHLGAMAGTVDIVQRCYTGLEIRDDTVILNPLLPDELPSLEFDMHYRGHWLRLTIDHEHVSITSSPGPARPVRVHLREQAFTVRAGDRIDMPWVHPSLRRPG